MTYQYLVYYGTGGYQRCPNWREASAYIKYCLDNDYMVRSVVRTPNRLASNAKRDAQRTLAAAKVTP